MGERKMEMTTMTRQCFVLLAVLLGLHSGDAAKFEFTDTLLAPLMQIARRHAMYTASDSPSTSAPGNGDSHVDIDIQFRASSPDLGATPSLRVIFFHHDQLDEVHQADDDGNFCCTFETEQGWGCVLNGELVPTYTPLYQIEVPLPANGSVFHLKHTVEVAETGMHYLMYSSCRVDNPDILMTGHNAWLNPYGYLPGELYFNLPFFMAMAASYLVVVLVWGALILYHRADGVLPVQYHIGAVAVLGLIEVSAWYLTFQWYNDNGTRPVPMMTTAVIFSTIKKTVSRILILVVCMGYGIAKPTLGSNGKKVLIFGFVYCVFTTILDVVKALSHENDTSGGFFILVIVPVALLDSIFYYWTFVSLYDVVAALEERRQTIKLALYKKFVTVIAVCLVVSLFWVMYQMYFLYSDSFTTQWQYAWVFDAFWYVQGLVLLICIMALWKPSSTSMNYAYHDQVSGVDDNLEGIELDDNTAVSFSIDDGQEEEGEFGDADMALDPELTQPKDDSKAKDDI